MRVLNKQQEYFPKTFSFSHERIKPTETSLTSEGFKKFQDKVLKQKWDIHRKIKESLMELDSKSVVAEEKKKQQEEEFDMIAELKQQQAYENLRRKAAEIIKKREFKLFRKVTAVMRIRNVKNRAAKYLYQTNLLKKYFRMLSNPSTKQEELWKTGKLQEKLETSKKRLCLRLLRYEKNKIKNLEELINSRLIQKKAQFMKKLINYKQKTSQDETIEIQMVMKVAMKRLLNKLKMNQIIQKEREVQKKKALILTGPKLFQLIREDIKIRNKESMNQNKEKIREQIKKRNAKQFFTNLKKMIKPHQENNIVTFRGQDLSKQPFISTQNMQTQATKIKYDQLQNKIFMYQKRKFFSNLQSLSDKKNSFKPQSLQQLIFFRRWIKFNQRQKTKQMNILQIYQERTKTFFKNLKQYYQQIEEQKFKFNVAIFKKILKLQMKGFRALKQHTEKKKTERKLMQVLEKRISTKLMLTAMKGWKQVINDNDKTKQNKQKNTNKRSILEDKNKQKRKVDWSLDSSDSEQSEQHKTIQNNESYDIRDKSNENLLRQKSQQPHSYIRQLVPQHDDQQKHQQSLDEGSYKQLNQNSSVSSQDGTQTVQKISHIQKIINQNCVKQFYKDLARKTSHDKKSQTQTSLVSEFNFRSKEIRIRHKTKLRALQKIHKQHFQFRNIVNQYIKLVNLNFKRSAVKFFSKLSKLAKLKNQQMQVKSLEESKQITSELQSNTSSKCLDFSSEVEKAKSYRVNLNSKQLFSNLKQEPNLKKQIQSIQRTRKARSINQFLQLLKSNIRIKQLIEEKGKLSKILKINQLKGAFERLKTVHRNNLQLNQKSNQICDLIQIHNKQLLIDKLQQNHLIFKEISQQITKSNDLTNNVYKKPFIINLKNNAKVQVLQQKITSLRTQIIKKFKRHFFHQLRIIKFIKNIDKIDTIFKTILLKRSFDKINSQIKEKQQKALRLTETINKMLTKHYFKKLISELIYLEQIQHKEQKLTKINQKAQIKKWIEKALSSILTKQSLTTASQQLVNQRKSMDCKLALKKMRQNKDNQQIKKIRKERNNNMLKYSTYKHEENLKVASFKALKQYFTQSQKNKMLTLLTSSFKGWKNVHIENKILTKYLSQYESPSYYPKSSEDKANFEAIKQKL